MKKILVALAAAIILGGCSNDTSLPVKSAEEAVQMYDNKETMILVVGSTTCDACQSYKSVLKEYYKNYPDSKLYLMYIDHEDAVEVDGETKRVHYAELEERLGVVKSTPTTFLIVDGEIKDTIVGNAEYEKVKSKIEKAGLLPAEK